MREYDIPELLANLAPGPMSVEGRIWKSNGHIPSLSENIISHALARVRTPGSGYLLRVKYAGQMMFLNDLDIALWMRTADIATKRDWKYPKEYNGTELLRRLGQLAILENIHPHTCPSCNGRREALINNKLITCLPCQGSGRIYPNDRKRQLWLQIDKDLWPDAREWYKRVQQVVQGWEMDALSRFSEALFPRGVDRGSIIKIGESKSSPPPGHHTQTVKVTDQTK